MTGFSIRYVWNGSDKYPPAVERLIEHFNADETISFAVGPVAAHCRVIAWHRDALAREATFQLVEQAKPDA